VTGIVCGIIACPEHEDEPLDDCVACAEAFWGRVFAHVSRTPGPDAIVLHMSGPGDDGGTGDIIDDWDPDSPKARQP